MSISQCIAQLAVVVGAAQLHDYCDIDRDAGGQVRSAYKYFALSCALRTDNNSHKLAHFASDLRGDGPVSTAWELWLSVLQKDEEHANALAQRLFRMQNADGTWHALNVDTNLDAFVFDELCTLHALGNAAIETGRLDWKERVRKGCLYHLENTQPDNTTNQPWALAAFAMHEDTLSLIHI